MQCSRPALPTLASRRSNAVTRWRGAKPSTTPGESASRRGAEAARRRNPRRRDSHARRRAARIRPDLRSPRLPLRRGGWGLGAALADRPRIFGPGLAVARRVCGPIGLEIWLVRRTVRVECGNCAKWMMMSV